VLKAAIPPARVIHTACTGYAGLAAATAKARTGAPMLLTEHGIYTKERRIEFNQATWIRDWDPREVVARSEMPYFEGLWTRHFESMSAIAYHSADSIYTLFDGNREKQVLEGADRAKVRVVPNGIDRDAFERALARARDAGPVEKRRFTVGFVGRLTPVKDLVTLLRAMRLVADRVPDLAVEVLGPADEDSAYAADCRRLTEALGLSDIVTFRGRGDTAAALPNYDVLCLTSISEAQPLVVLEAGAAGVPVVATAVGSCPELLLGGTSEDRALGAGGILTPIASPGATAEAVLRLHASPELRRRMGEVLKTRVERSYGMGDMITSYGAIYDEHGRAA
jgi:glycosyltransferase involved in cell wall biosynthesis